MSPTVRVDWTVEEDESLRALALTGESAAAIDRRSADATRTRARKLGIALAKQRHRRLGLKAKGKCSRERMS